MTAAQSAPAYGPENITPLATLRHQHHQNPKAVRSVPQKIAPAHRNVRLVFDYLRMTKNSCDAASRN